MRRSASAPLALYALVIALGVAEKLVPQLRVPFPAPPAYRPALYALGVLGSVEVVWAAAIAYAAYSYIRWRRLPATLLASLLLAEVLDGILKVSFSVCRPLESCPPYRILMVDSYSYPSGHSTRTFSIPLTVRDEAARWALFAFAAAVAVSRVLIEVHYPLDVVGGAFLGLASSLVAGQLVRRLRLHELEAGAGERLEQGPGYP